MFIALDIETAPNALMIDHLPEPDVKTGNLKDPEKIAAKIDEAKASQVSKMALDPLYARIICASVVSDDISQTRMACELDSDDVERSIVEWILEILGEDQVRLVTWNGVGFDLPMIYKRALCLGLVPSHYGAPPLTAWTKRYDNDRHIDLMKVFAGWGSCDYAKLDTVAAVVLGESKNEVDVTTFEEMIKTEEGRQKICDYCEKDTALTYSLFKKMQGVLFA